jgi:hypothetical protein
LVISWAAVLVNEHRAACFDKVKRPSGLHRPSSGVAEPDAGITMIPSSKDAGISNGAVDQERDAEPFDPHPDTPDDLDDDFPARESIEAVQEDE